MGPDRAELGAFLRARRDRLTPAQAGMEPFPGARRVPGLRRDELAVLAGVSPDYYSRVEQGRQANVSADVLDALARALRLDAVETAHLHELAGPPSPVPDAAGPPQRADPGLLRVMTAVDHLPALLLGRRSEVLARTALIPVLLGAPLPVGDVFARYLFCDPEARRRIVNWTVFAQGAVAGLRRETGRRRGDRRLHDLVEELRAADPLVGTWWDDHAVRDYSSQTKRIRHDTGDELEFDVEVVAPPQEPDQHLVIYTVQPGSATARMLPLLASWAGTVAAT